MKHCPICSNSFTGRKKYCSTECILQGKKIFWTQYKLRGNKAKIIMTHKNGKEIFPKGFCERCGIKLSHKKCGHRGCGVVHGEYKEGETRCLDCSQLSTI